ncbi:receptor-like protein kinase, partial [Trifolium pratense]
DESGVIQISVGPSDLSSSIRINAILNGAEIMKMVNDVDNTKTVHRRRRQLWELLCSIVGGIVVLFIAVTVFLLPTKCRKREPKESAAESVGWTPLRMLGGSSLSRTSEHGSYGYLGMKIPFADVQSATNNFDRNLIIGYGGFGMVYKGVLRDNVKVAVKRGMPGSRQGLPEFHTEISVLSKIRHRHLVSLVGFCEENSEMILYLSMSM